MKDRNHSKARTSSTVFDSLQSLFHQPSVSGAEAIRKDLRDRSSKPRDNENEPPLPFRKSMKDKQDKVHYQRLSKNMNAVTDSLMWVGSQDTVSVRRPDSERNSKPEINLSEDNPLLMKRKNTRRVVADKVYFETSEHYVLSTLENVTIHDSGVSQFRTMKPALPRTNFSRRSTKPKKTVMGYSSLDPACSLALASASIPSPTKRDLFPKQHRSDKERDSLRHRRVSRDQTRSFVNGLQTFFDSSTNVPIVKSEAWTAAEIAVDDAQSSLTARLIDSSQEESAQEQLTPMLLKQQGYPALPNDATSVSNVTKKNGVGDSILGKTLKRRHRTQKSLSVAFTGDFPSTSPLRDTGDLRLHLPILGSPLLSPLLRKRSALGSTPPRQAFIDAKMPQSPLNYDLSEISQDIAANIVEKFNSTMTQPTIFDSDSKSCVSPVEDNHNAFIHDTSASYSCVPSKSLCALDSYSKSCISPVKDINDESNQDISVLYHCLPSQSRISDAGTANSKLQTQEMLESVAPLLQTRDMSKSSAPIKESAVQVVVAAPERLPDPSQVESCVQSRNRVESIKDSTNFYYDYYQNYFAQYPCIPRVNTDPDSKQLPNLSSPLDPQDHGSSPSNVDELSQITMSVATVDHIECDETVVLPSFIDVPSLATFQSTTAPTIDSNHNLNDTQGIESTIPLPIQIALSETGAEHESRNPATEGERNTLSREIEATNSQELEERITLRRSTRVRNAINRFDSMPLERKAINDDDCLAIASVMSANEVKSFVVNDQAAISPKLNKEMSKLCIDDQCIPNTEPEAPVPIRRSARIRQVQNTTELKVQYSKESRAKENGSHPEAEVTSQTDVADLPEPLRIVNDKSPFLPKGKGVKMAGVKMASTKKEKNRVRFIQRLVPQSAVETGLVTNEIIDEWSSQQIMHLREAFHETDPTSASFWIEVAERMPLSAEKSAYECREKWFSLASTPKQMSRRTTHRKKDTSLAQKQKSTRLEEDDIFNSTPMRQCTNTELDCLLPITADLEWLQLPTRIASRD